VKAWNPGARYFLFLAVVAILAAVGAGCLPFPDRAPTWVTPSTPASVPLSGSAGR
jgi:hypothetical protein